MIVLFLAAPLAAEKLRLEKSMDAMGTAFSVVVYGTDREKMEAAVDAAFGEARRLDELLSNYKPESEWSLVNRYAAERAVKVSPELFRLLSACRDYSQQSEGAFDITVGRLMKLWGFYRGTGRLPHRSEVRAAMPTVGYQHMILDPVHQTVRFDRRGVEIDPGGIGKGYAVDSMVEILRARGILAAMVSGGGSSIFGLGAPPEEPRGWNVTIRDPKDPRRHVAEVFLKNESMSTSGSYEKFFRAGGKTYSHIMDPRTGYPAAAGVVSVSVIAPKTLDSEAWTKPAFINGRDWMLAHMPKGLRVFLCEDRMNQPCAWLQ